MSLPNAYPSKKVSLDTRPGRPVQAQVTTSRVHDNRRERGSKISRKAVLPCATRQATQVSRPPPSASNDEHDDLLRLPGLRGPDGGELRHVGELALPQVGLDDLLEDVAQRRLVLRVHIGDVLEAAGEVDDHLADALLVEQPHLPLLRPAVLRDGVEHPERVPASAPLGVGGGAGPMAAAALPPSLMHFVRGQKVVLHRKVFAIIKHPRMHSTPNVLQAPQAFSKRQGWLNDDGFFFQKKKSSKRHLRMVELKPQTSNIHQ